MAIELPPKVLRATSNAIIATTNCVIPVVNPVSFRTSRVNPSIPVPNAAANFWALRYSSLNCSNTNRLLRVELLHGVGGHNRLYLYTTVQDRWIIHLQKSAFRNEVRLFNVGASLARAG